jgi:hypothetical protein
LLPAFNGDALFSDRAAGAIVQQDGLAHCCATRPGKMCGKIDGSRETITGFD